MAYGRTNAAGGMLLGKWKFLSVAALPAAVAKNTVLAVTDTTPTSIVLAETTPETPAEGMLWFLVYDPTDGMMLSGCTVPFRMGGAYQYVSGAWVQRDAYYTYLDTWRAVPGLPPVGVTLADCTWTQIHRIAAAGRAADYFCIGDEKQIALSTSEVVTLQIVGFDHDDLSAAGGGKAPITLCFQNALNAVQGMNASGTNTGGYSGSTLYPTVNGALYGALPSELRAVMQNVHKLTSAGGQSASIVTTQEKLFLLSEVEVFGACSYAKAGEGTQYAFFTNGGARAKTVNGTAGAWWLRSPYGAGTAYYCAVTAAGGVTNLNANVTAGVALALCV